MHVSYMSSVSAIFLTMTSFQTLIVGRRALSGGLYVTTMYSLYTSFACIFRIVIVDINVPRHTKKIIPSVQVFMHEAGECSLPNHLFPLHVFSGVKHLTSMYYIASNVMQIYLIYLLT